MCSVFSDVPYTGSCSLQKHWGSGNWTVDWQQVWPIRTNNKGKNSEIKGKKNMR